MAIAAPFPSVRATTPARRSTPVRRSTAAAAPIRLTRRGRVVLTVAVCLAALAGLVATGPGADAASSSAGSATSIVVVQAGETVWSIAKTLDPSADPRELVARIRELNNLTSGVIVPGQALVVPA